VDVAGALRIALERDAIFISAAEVGTRHTLMAVIQWSKVRKLARVDRATWLLLRHTFGSELAQMGVPLIKIARWMGNSLAVCERRYVGLIAYDSASDRLME